MDARYAAAATAAHLANVQQSVASSMPVHPQSICGVSNSGKFMKIIILLNRFLHSDFITQLFLVI